MTSDYRDADPAGSDELSIETEAFGPEQAAIDRVRDALEERQEVRDRLQGTEHRLLAFELVEPPRKLEKPQPPDAYRTTYYDYTNNRSVAVEGRFADQERLTVTESAAQPLPTAEEFGAAVEILAQDPVFRSAVHEHLVQPYPAMPPVIEAELPDGRIERTLAVGLLPTEENRDGRHEIVGVNMIQRRVDRYDERAPATARADARTCGAPVSAGQPTTGRGVAGQVWITVVQGGTVLWRFLAVRPSASSGNWGSGVELRYLEYRGRSVLYQAHVPILNVLYGGNACGPYRDWQWEEGMLQANGNSVAPGFLLCPTPAKTILDTGSDAGTFLGVAIYVAGQEVVLVSEMQAGWYRYISEWRLHSNGTIRPRFGFDATSSSCVCNRHHHHVYWRLDFDIETAGGNLIREFNNPPISPGTNWHTKPYEIMRLRSPARGRRWRVENAATLSGQTSTRTNGNPVRLTEGVRRCERRGMERSVYDAAGGSVALGRLAEAWHGRCLQDPVVSHAFSHPGLHPQHVERLAAYWGEALGGPAGYTAGMGDHSHVLRLHAGNGEHDEMDRRAQQCFALALDDAGVPGDPRLRRTLMDWFAWMTAAMAAYPRSPEDVPDGLALPVWSWNGPVNAP